MPGPETDTTRSRILAAARAVLARNADAPIAAIASSARVSRATVHRYFRTRADLLAAVDVEPDPDARARVLSAAAEIIGRVGLGALSMDELAVRAGVSRATVYRLFPGKPALVEALLNAYTPFEPIIARLRLIGDRPPEEVLPELLRSAATIAADNVGILRAIFFEVTSGTPDAIEGSARPLEGMIRAFGGYLARQMVAGSIRAMHPVLAVESLLGPLIFFVLTRSSMERLAALDIPFEEAVAQLIDVTLRGLGPSPASDTSIREWY